MDPRYLLRYVLPYQVSGLTLTADEILSLSTVWACMDAIARAIGQCPWNVYRWEAYQHRGRAKLRRELLHDDPLMWIFNTQPNPEMTAIGFREAMLFQAIAYGNSYAEIVTDRAGRPRQLWPLLQDRVTPRRDWDTWELYYEYRQPSDGQLVRLAQNQIFHLRGPGISGLLGENLVARAAKSLAVAAAQERYSAAYFGQGANPGGVLTYPHKLSPEQWTLLQDDFAAKRKGPENAHKPLILENGMKWEATANEPQKAQLVEGRQFSVEEICRWFGVPPHKVQHLLRATFNNIEHLSIEFVRDAVNPWCRRMTQEADVKLIRQDRAPWRHTRIDTSELLMGDAQSRAAAHAIWRQNGIMSANEIREREGLNDAGDDGDVLLVQSNLTTVERIVIAPLPGAAGALLAGDDANLDPSAEPDQAEEDEEGDAGDEQGEEDDPAGEQVELRRRPTTHRESTEDEVVAVARGALVAIMGGALDRYARRLANRRTDLERRPRPAREIDDHLRVERERLRPGLLAELDAAAPFAVRVFGRALTEAELLRAIERVDAGEPAAAVAERPLPETCPRPG